MFKKMIGLCLSLALIGQAYADALVVYSGRGEASVGPILERFQEETGIELDVRYNSTPALATQVLHEGKDTPADVVFFQESGYLGVLAEAGLLANLNDALLDPVVPEYRDPDGRWLGTSGRLRVLVYNTDQVDPADLPSTLQGLADPKWQKQVGWAPTNASAQAHMSALRQLWSSEALRTWLAAMRDNQSINYPKNAQIVLAVSNGEIQLGWANHYYLHRLKQQNPNMAAANYHFPEAGEAGNVFIISGAGIVAESRNYEQAELLLAFLTSEAIQRYFTEQGFEYPTRADIPAHPDLVALDQLPLADVSQSSLANVMPTITVLQELGLL